MPPQRTASIVGEQARSRPGSEGGILEAMTGTPAGIDGFIDALGRILDDGD